MTPALKPARTAFSLPGVNETAASSVVATYGTEGDARPLAALCRGLMDAGHEALLLADEATLGSAQALGVPIRHAARSTAMKPPLIDLGSFSVQFSYVHEVAVARCMCRQFFEVPLKLGELPILI